MIDTAQAWTCQESINTGKMCTVTQSLWSAGWFQQGNFTTLSRGWLQSVYASANDVLPYQKHQQAELLQPEPGAPTLSGCTSGTPPRWGNKQNHIFLTSILPLQWIHPSFNTYKLKWNQVVLHLVHQQILIHISHGKPSLLSPTLAFHTAQELNSHFTTHPDHLCFAVQPSSGSTATKQSIMLPRCS